MKQTDKPNTDKPQADNPQTDKQLLAQSTDEKPSSTGEKPSTDAKPSTTDIKPSTDEKPSTAGAKPSTTDIKPSTADAKPSTTDEKPSTTDAKPSTTDEKPSTTDIKPSTTDAKPSTTDAKPSTTDIKPSTADEKPSTQASKQSPKNPVQKPSKKCSKLNCFLLYLLILITAAISYILWEKNQQITTKLTTITQQQSQSTAQIKQLKKQQTQHTEILNLIHKNNQQNNYQHNLGHAKIKHLITIANQSLILQNDIKTSIAALQSADKEIKNTGDPRLITVRQQLLADIAQLESNAQTDITGLALTITNSILNISQLPLKNQLLHKNPNNSQPAPTTEPTEWWKKISHLLWQEIRKLIIITRTETQNSELMLPETINLLRANLTLELTNARQAILNRDTENLQASITLIRHWLAKYFAQQNPHVIQLDTTLRNMQQIALKPPPHDLNTLLETLHNAQTKQP